MSSPPHSIGSNIKHANLLSLRRQPPVAEALRKSEYCVARKIDSPEDAPTEVRAICMMPAKPPGAKADQPQQQRKTVSDQQLLEMKWDSAIQSGQGTPQTGGAGKKGKTKAARGKKAGVQGTGTPALQVPGTPAPLVEDLTLTSASSGSKPADMANPLPASDSIHTEEAARNRTAAHMTELQAASLQNDNADRPLTEGASMLTHSSNRPAASSHVDQAAIPHGARHVACPTSYPAHGTSSDVGRADVRGTDIQAEQLSSNPDGLAEVASLTGPAGPAEHSNAGKAKPDQPMAAASGSLPAVAFTSRTEASSGESPAPAHMSEHILEVSC